MSPRRTLWVLGLTALACACVGASAARSTAPSTAITARELVQPGALVGQGPESLLWSPRGALLAYTDALGDDVALYLYDAAEGATRVLLDPASAPDDIDVTTAQWSPDGDRLLLAGGESLWVLDAVSGSLSKVPVGGRGPAGAMQFTPSGHAVSYASGNDLYVTTLRSGRVRRLTTGGSEAVFNGCLDWVYNEELATRAAQPGYAWSPDGRTLMYMCLDDRRVSNDPTTDFTTTPPAVSYTRYPYAGTKNPKVSLHWIGSGPRRTGGVIPLPDDAEYVLPFYAWTPDSKEILYISVDRDHTVLKLNAFAPRTARSRVVIRETDSAWINEDFVAAPVFLPGGERFLWLSERDGYMHLYLYARDGTLVRQVTDGDWLIDTTPYGILTAGRPIDVDPTGTWAYYVSTAQGPLQRQIARVEIATGEVEQLTTSHGFHATSLSADGHYLVDQWSNVDTPPVTSILDAAGAFVAELGRCAGPSLDLPDVQREFLTLPAHDGTTLYAQLVKPADFDPGKKYPVVVHWYGGPGLQLVSDRYGTTNIFNLIERDTLYTQAGYLVWRLDNRGSFGRGHGFETPIAGELGPAALDDQLAGIDYLATLPYVDTARIGTDGKSFGGYLTLYALINEPGVFRCGVAGSGPTDWAWYDTIYTERYMRTPAENPDGYAATDLVAVADHLQVAPLIVHGLNDTNVHLQNSVEFVAALERDDRPFVFVPLPGCDHHYGGDALATVLNASVAYFEDRL